MEMQEGCAPEVENTWLHLPDLRPLADLGEQCLNIDDLSVRAMRHVIPSRQRQLG